jgi:four helix bundle protein
MSNGKLDDFKAYQKSLELFDMVVQDINQSLRDRRLDRLVSQQLASADSVCSNIEEGYGR